MVDIIHIELLNDGTWDDDGETVCIMRCGLELTVRKDASIAPSGHDFFLARSLPPNEEEVTCRRCTENF